MNKGEYLVDGMKLMKLTLNGVDITDKFVNIYFQIRHPILEKAGQHSIYKLDQVRTKDKSINQRDRANGTKTDGVSKIFMASFNSADDFSNLIHEQGHCNDPEVRNEEKSQRRSGIASIKESELKAMNEEKQLYALESWKGVIAEELRANKNALLLLREISQKTIIFPQDSKVGFQRFIIGREATLATYLNEHNGMV